MPNESTPESAPESAPAAQTITSATMPQPMREQRDDNGRRIAVTFESAHPPFPSAANDSWLVAIDGSEHAMNALAMAERLSTEAGVRVLDLVNVQPWLSKEAANHELAPRGWAIAADACAKLGAKDFAWRLHILMGEPARRIVEQAEALGSRGIVIGARGLTATEALLIGSVALRVIHTAHGSVLVVRHPEPFGKLPQR